MRVAEASALGWGATHILACRLYIRKGKCIALSLSLLDKSSTVQQKYNANYKLIFKWNLKFSSSVKLATLQLLESHVASGPHTWHCIPDASVEDVSHCLHKHYDWGLQTCHTAAQYFMDPTILNVEETRLWERSPVFSLLAASNKYFLLLIFVLVVSFDLTPTKRRTQFAGDKFWWLWWDLSLNPFGFLQLPRGNAVGCSSSPRRICLRCWGI